MLQILPYCNEKSLILKKKCKKNAKKKKSNIVLP